MARLTDITLYDQFHPAEGQRQFQQRANDVSGLYGQCLRGYKPPRTTRISITLVPEQRLPRAWMAGSVAVNVVVAPTDEEADFLFTSVQQRFLGMRRGVRGPLPRPVVSMDGLWSEAERQGVEQMLAASAVGGPGRVASRLSQIVAATAADELIVAGALHEHALRVRSYQILAGLRQQLTAARAA